MSGKKVKIGASMTVRKRKTHFLERPRRWRNKAYIAVKNRIRRDAPTLGGHFTTHHDMCAENSWIDAFFLGLHSPVFYNLALDTTRGAYEDAVWDQAWEESYARAEDLEPSLFDRLVKDPATGHLTIPARESICYRQLDGMKRVDWVASQLPRIADSKVINVQEEWHLQYDYTYGIGLHATIDEPHLTIDTVNAFIRKFLVTQADYQSMMPLSYKYEEIKHWG